MLAHWYIIHGSDTVTVRYAVNRIAGRHHSVRFVDQAEEYYSLMTGETLGESPDLIVIQDWENWPSTTWKKIRKTQSPARSVFVSRQDKIRATHPILKLPVDKLHYALPSHDKDWIIWIEKIAKRIGAKINAPRLWAQIGPHAEALYSEIIRQKITGDEQSILPLRSFDPQGAAYQTYQAWQSARPQLMFQFSRGQHPTTYWEHLQKEFIRRAKADPTTAHARALSVLGDYTGWNDMSWIDPQLGLRHSLIQLYCARP